jgi:hypothetical protein
LPGVPQAAIPPGLKVVLGDARIRDMDSDVAVRKGGQESVSAETFYRFDFRNLM